MMLSELSLAGAWLIEPELHEDDRGYFARGKCARVFEDNGIPSAFVQTNLSRNSRTGTFRGLHYQVPPSKEGKLVRCVSGKILDILVDLRPDSATFLSHQSVELGENEMNAVFVPSGFAHGFLTLSDDSLVIYEMSDYFAPELARGIRWDDPAIEIELPVQIERIHPRDAAYPDIDPGDLRCFCDGAT